MDVRVNSDMDDVSHDDGDTFMNTGDADTNTPDALITAINWTVGAGDITPQKDGSVLKLTIEDGIEEEFPSEGDTVTVSYDGFYEDGRLFDSSHGESNPYEFVIGKGKTVITLLQVFGIMY